MSNDEESESKELVKVETLTPRSREVNTIVKVVSKSEARSVSQDAHKVVDAMVGDETGSIILTLWDDTIEQVEEGATISVTNGYVNLFRGNMRLNIGRYGKLDILEETPIEDVNVENNLSEKRYEQERRNRRQDYSRSYRPRYGGRRDSQRRRY
jgi:replication factor A1